MDSLSLIIISCGALAIVYAIFAASSVFACSAGTDRMQEIARAIQEGAKVLVVPCDRCLPRARRCRWRHGDLVLDRSA